ncbi:MULTISPECIES: DNA methyltransferase [Bacillaceae]|uniref:DNA methyltransferase n=1 Tax=Bacillaceae TaxID=186817 RepID=UPI0023B1A2E4
MPHDFWGTGFGTNQQGTAEIKSLFRERVFDYPKPEMLMYHLLKIGSNVNDIVLDFFMGSATTQAVAHKMNISVLKRWITYIMYQSRD